MFVTLEDETGKVNVIVWPSLPEKQRREALGATLLAVYGTWQCEGKVRHLVAQRLVDMKHPIGGLTTVSKNFCSRVAVPVRRPANRDPKRPVDGGESGRLKFDMSGDREAAKLAS